MTSQLSTASEILTREDQDIDTWKKAIDASMATDFPLGPRIPFIQFGRFLALADKVSLNLEDKKCIDFGCGATRPFSIATLMFLFGAKNVVAIDVVPFGNHSAVAQGLWHMLAVLALEASGLEKYSTYKRKLIKSRLAEFDLAALREGRLMEGLPKAIQQNVGDYLAIEKYVGTFDVMISNSVFEHIPKLKETMQLLRKNLQPEGCIYTDIDYRDHRMYVSGLSPWAYLLDDGDVSSGYINKIRHSAMMDLIDETGFRVIASDQVVNTPPPQVTENIHSRYGTVSGCDLMVVQDTLLLMV
jgi:2-polyprenyl-3-methyl-5-hydroxy-6-metoxy-1,4-benzoquinol methylase